ncbi:hypothetical protein PT277_07775 [Acetobacteraceae bacterium ESL0709]|nr:hypothetical protein [Acetobacteraceae bacterium ESL0697]MDF7678577.1 hypothetical protein [Acetobacteraceae bacterium ESL0709]
MPSHLTPITWLQALWDARQFKVMQPGQRRPSSLIRLYALETGSCEGCAMELRTLAGGAFALKASGFEFVPAPGEADWLLVTGAVTRSNAGTLLAAWQSMQGRKLLVAVGACGLDGGPFTASYAVLGGVRPLSRHYQVIKGCPPSPQDVLQALGVLAEEVWASPPVPAAADSE